MEPAWTVVSVTGDDIDATNSVEQMGSKEKYWVRLPDQHRWLLKVARGNEHDEVISGEDWAEYTVHHLASLLGVPTATVRPALYDGRRAIVSRSVLREDGLQALVHGNELLAGRDPAYDPQLRGNNPRYTLNAVHDVLDEVSPPNESEWPANLTAFDVWAGYLILDAWVAGRDRHHENWAVIRTGDRQSLAPSFDHGNALGFQERDAKRERMLSDPALFTRWLDRGTSPHFAGRPHLVDLAHDAVGLASASARRHWEERLAGVSPCRCASIIESIPSHIMSEVARTFVSEVLVENRRRILDGYATR